MRFRVWDVSRASSPKENDTAPLGTAGIPAHENEGFRV